MTLPRDRRRSSGERNHRGPLPAILVAAAVATVLLATATPRPAEAIPPFARRYETSCGSCHQGHYPRLNAFGRQFRDNGYQLPDGAEDWARAQRTVEPGAPEGRLAVFKEVPLSLRGQVFGVVSAAPEDPLFTNALFSFLVGGGTVGEDVSYFFTWTPFPDPALHQARVGFHNLFEKHLGSGTLNLRAGSLFLLDFQRPGHRFLSPGADSATALTVGNNAFSLAEPSLGVQLYGRPGWGPLHYELAVVAGDAPNGIERDDWKDVFARVSVTAFQNTDHELTPGVFAYVGRSEFETELGDLVLAQRDDFWIAGGDLEFDIGPFNLSAMGFASRHSDPKLDGTPVAYTAVRAEALWVPHTKWVASVRFEEVSSADDPSLRRTSVAPHLTRLLSPNVLITLVWRHDLLEIDGSSAVLVVDVTF
jgi:hypothetical protein